MAIRQYINICLCCLIYTTNATSECLERRYIPSVNFFKLRKPLYLLTSFKILRICIISANTIGSNCFVTSDRLEVFVGFLQPLL